MKETLPTIVRCLTLPVKPVVAYYYYYYIIFVVKKGLYSFLINCFFTS